MILLSIISLFTILLPSGMVFYQWKSTDIATRPIRLLLIITLILDSIIYYYFITGQNKNNMFLFHVFTFLEMILLILYFRSFFRQNWIRRMFFVLLLLFSVMVVLNIFYWESLDDFPSIPRTIECVVVMILSILFFINLFQQSTVSSLMRYNHFWLVSGLLLFFAGTFFMNIVGSLVINKNDLGFNVYDIHSFLNIFLNIIYTIALWMSSRRLISAQ